MPSDLELARRAVRAAAETLRLAGIAGRAELRETGAVSAEQWQVVERLHDELTERLGELERAERQAGLR